MAAKQPKSKRKPQSQRFIEAAREAEASEDEAVFNENLAPIGDGEAPRRKTEVG